MEFVTAAIHLQCRFFLAASPRNEEHIKGRKKQTEFLEVEALQLVEQLLHLFPDKVIHFVLGVIIR